MKKFFAAVLTVFLSLGLLTACGGGQQHGASSAPAVQSVERSDTGSADKSKSRIRQNKIYTDSESISQNGEQFSAKSPGSAEIHVEPDQAYTDKDHVALVPITTPSCQRYISLSWDENTPLTPPAEELKNYFIKNFKRFAEQYAGVNSSI